MNDWFAHLPPPHNWVTSGTASHVHHRPWTEAELTKLITLHRNGRTTDDMSEALERPRGSVAKKVSELQDHGVLARRLRSVRGEPPERRS